MAEGRKRRVGSEAARPEIANPDRIIDGALSLIAAQGWRNVSLAAVADEAGLPILQVYRLFPSKTAILCSWSSSFSTKFSLVSPPMGAPCSSVTVTNTLTSLTSTTIVVEGSDWPGECPRFCWAGFCWGAVSCAQSPQIVTMKPSRSRIVAGFLIE